ncbi:unnamed protein product [Symbiodinium natans]|uniref:Transmembrane protein n=1 Tax=Symbiodinium natans TaxID=878477 RepID=A0A812JWT4_9DINO|nr:unnamed protein product [Symbiodinium natans]
MPSGPIIEELPDDYDIAAHKKEAASSSSGSLRKGFLASRQSAPPTPEAATTSAPAKSTEGESSTASTSKVPEAEEALNSLEGLRRRLQHVLDDTKEKQRRTAEQAEADRAQQAQSLDAALAAFQVKWPTSAMKEKQAKASKEIDTGLAELRAAFNDSRRRRSGDDRKALSALKVAAEEAISRVQKAADGANANKGSAEDRQIAAVAAFHAMPLTAKLRILAQEKKASAALLGGSFLLGTLAMLGICLEIYTAWGCRLQCS